jgi:hypothetical protein
MHKNTIKYYIECVINQMEQGQLMDSSLSDLQLIDNRTTRLFSFYLLNLIVQLQSFFFFEVSGQKIVGFIETIENITKFWRASGTNPLVP